MRNVAKDHSAHIYPSYNKLLESKKSCYPEGYVISKHGAEVHLQSLLNHTVQRLCMSLEPELSTIIMDKNIKRLNLQGKWGVDGATGQSLYKQTMEGDRDFAAEESIFITSYVPLQLTGISANEVKTSIWINPRPSSTLYCRPISFKFSKETRNLTISTIDSVNRQIECLCTSNVLTTQGVLTSM